MELAASRHHARTRTATPSGGHPRSRVFFLATVLLQVGFVSSKNAKKYDTDFFLPIAILDVLAHFDGKVPPAWPFGATLNTFLAFFSSISKMAFMVSVVQGLGQLRWLWFLGPKHKPLHDFHVFDEASRGAYGSFRLLLQFKGYISRSPKTQSLKLIKNSWLGCLAAVISISGFLTSTFTQQVIHYPVRLSEAEDVTASLHVSRKFSLYDGGQYLTIRMHISH